jgi:hypothetical protein
MNTKWCPFNGSLRRIFEELRPGESRRIAGNKTSGSGVVWVCS